MTLTKLFLLCAAAFVALAETSWGQRASNWRVYKVADGLPESACMSVEIGRRGKILVRHFDLASVSELDGYRINVIPAPKLGSSRVYESPGGQLWTVSPDGLLEFADPDWVLHPVAEIAAEFRTSVPHVIHPVPLCPVWQDHVLFLLPDRLMEFSAEDPAHPRTELLRTAGQTQLERFTGMTVAHDGGLWIAGAHGLAKVPPPLRTLTPETGWREYLPPDSLHVQNLQEPQEDVEGGVTVVAESSNNRQKLIVHFDGQHWTAWSAGTEMIRYAWRGPDGEYWAATIRSLFQFDEQRGELVENEDISARQYFDLAVEPGGAFWLATSDGLFRYALPIWSSPRSVQRITSAVRGLAADAAGRLWFVAGGELHELQNSVQRAHPFPANAARSLQDARALFPLENGTLLLDAGDQLFQFQPGTDAFSTVSAAKAGGGFSPLGLLKDGSLCVQSFPPGASNEYRLELYDGTRFQVFPYAQPNPAAIGQPTALFAAQNGDLWLSGELGTVRCSGKKWQVFSSPDKSSPEAAVCFAEPGDGRIWCATQDTIWEFDGHNWLTVRSGFDRINAMLRSGDGSVWVASNGGLHHYFQGAWIENGPEEGLPSAAGRELCETPSGVWAATTRGLSLYHPDADRDPPRTYIQTPPESDRNIPQGGTITLTFSGQDRWKFTPRDRLLYSYRLDELEWSPFAENNAVSYPDLAPGKHVFQARAMDRNGNKDPNPARFEFAVILPWYRETRLVLISFAGLAVALFFAGLAFNRHRQLVHSYAEVEKKVADRTRELEIANRELLQSQKMKALGTLAAGIAHDFNNILSIVKGSAQIIEENVDNPQKVRTRVDRIKTVVEQGGAIVKAMLGFSRGSDEPAGPCDVNAIVDDTIKLLGDRFLREVDVSFERAPGLPEIAVSRDFVQQILLNLIFNAAESEAAAKRKQIIVAARPMDKLPADLALMPTLVAGYVAISVQDFGCGIPPENLPRIFEPFFTTKALSVRRGTGLGLSMAYELAKRMEAGLAVESVVNQGSTFTLILPVRDLPVELKSTTDEQE